MAEQPENGQAIQKDIKDKKPNIEEDKKGSPSTNIPTDPDSKRDSYQRFTDQNAHVLSLQDPNDCAKVFQYMGKDGEFLNAKLKHKGVLLSAEALEDPGQVESEKQKELSFLQWLLQLIMALFSGGLGKGKEKEKIEERLPAMTFTLDSAQQGTLLLQKQKQLPLNFLLWKER